MAGSRLVHSSALAWLLYCCRRAPPRPTLPAFGLIGALLAGAILATGLEGVGWRLRRTLVIPGLGLLDGTLGALLSAAVGLGIVWIVAAVAAQTPGQAQLRADIQRSAILRELNELLPPSGPILDALARLDPLPSIAGPSPDVAPPLPADRAHPGSARRVAERGARARHRLRAGDRGLGLGGAAGGGRDQRARRRGRAGHHGGGGRAARPACPRRRSRSTPPTTSRCCACPNLACPR